MRYSLLLLAALAGTAPAWGADRGVVIGNADYQTAPDLAGSDTAALVRVMRESGFLTAQGIDQPAAELRRTLDLIARRDEAPGTSIVALNGRFLNRDGETWFMGTDADQPGPSDVGREGVPLSLVIQLLAEAETGAVLLLGTDQQEMPHRAGLRSGIGELEPMPGVSVISGPPESTARALRELCAGHSVSRAMASARGLKLLPGGDVDMVPVRPSTRATADTLPEPTEADRDAWSEAVEIDSAEAYLGYLETYPSGLFAAAAEARRQALRERRGQVISDRDAWAAAAEADRVAAYQDYLRRFPAGLSADMARMRLKELGGVESRTVSRAPSGIEARLGLDRDGRQWVQRNLFRLGYEPGEADGVFGERTRDALRNWQEVNKLEPTGYLTSAQHELLKRQVGFLDGEGGRRDRDFWRRNGAGGGERQLHLYLRRYPDGIHAVEARRALAALAGSGAAASQVAGAAATWRWAKRQDSAAAYQSYLDRFADGVHAAEARQRRDNLKAATEAARREEDALDLGNPTRRRLEERLSLEGLDPGPVDGNFTEETRDALRLYQASQNLRVTGYVSPQTLARLLEESATQE